MRHGAWSWALVRAGRVLMRAAAALLGAPQAHWARAMRAEWEAMEGMQASGGGREALAFAWGCLVTALGQALNRTRRGLPPAQRRGVRAATAAVLLGCAFMHLGGAPGAYGVMNLLSLALALALFFVLPRRRLQADAPLRARLACALGALLLVTSLGPAAAGDAAWWRFGPAAWGLAVNLPWLLLPALLVAADLPSKAAAWPWALAGLAMACSALTLQGDAVLLGLTAAVLGVSAWHRRSGALLLLALVHAALAAHLAAAWQASPAAAFVDRVVWNALEQGPATGLVLALLQLLLLWPAWHQRQARLHGLVWGLLVALSLPGWLPSPLVGFGGSFILAYLLSLAVIGDDAADSADAPPRRAAVRHHPNPPGASCARLS